MQGEPGWSRDTSLRHEAGTSSIFHVWSQLSLCYTLFFIFVSSHYVIPHGRAKLASLLQTNQDVK